MKIMMIGAHGSGKTTYLGALWATLKAGLDTDAVKLRATLPAATTYLDEAEYALLAGEAVSRTKRDTGERVDLDLEVDGTPATIQYVDVAGETLEAFLEQRVAPASLLEELRGADGFMVFVHPRDIRTPYSIVEARELASVVLEGASPSVDCANISVGSSDFDDPSLVWQKAPSAVHLVEMVQVAVAAADHRVRTKIGVVVSAWDTVLQQSPGRVSPDVWLEGVLPLLHQYLKTNDDWIDSRVYGVSAQGCDFSDASAVATIIEKPYRERTLVAQGASVTTDIAEPLRWFVREHG